MSRKVIHYAGEIRLPKLHVLPGWSACCSGDRAEKIKRGKTNTRDPSLVTCKKCLVVLKRVEDACASQQQVNFDKFTVEHNPLDVAKDFAGAGTELLDELDRKTPDCPVVKPCPFCAGIAKIHTEIHEYGHIPFSKVAVCCDKCGGRGPEFLVAEAVPKAVKHWNTRLDDEVRMTEDELISFLREKLRISVGVSGGSYGSSGNLTVKLSLAADPKEIVISEDSVSLSDLRQD